MDRPARRRAAEAGARLGAGVFKSAYSRACAARRATSLASSALAHTDRTAESLPPSAKQLLAFVMVEHATLETELGPELSVLQHLPAAAKSPKPGTRKRSQQRELDRERRRKTGEDVFFLPGKIDIRQVQQLQEMETGAAGRGLMARFMVRGHWRRANATWEDQRTRWIEPYWKGPELAAVIEREYRLKT
jgi:hypothetical protein